MASKNLGAVIQRAISDGAFRRQLQSDPAAALRGFNLTPNEIAAIRSGDASKLMSLGVDQRVSKAFTVGGGFLGATRSASSDMGTGATSNGIVGDPTSARDALTSGNLSGTRAVNDSEPADLRGSVSDPTVSGTRAIHDNAPADLRSAATTGGADATRAIHDNAPADLRAAASTGDLSGTRAVHDSPPFEGNVNAVASGTNAGGNMIAADDNYSVASRMADSTADATRAVNDTAPFDSGVFNADASTGDVASGDMQHDPGAVDLHDGGALGNTGGGGGNTSS